MQTIHNYHLHHDANNSSSCVSVVCFPHRLVQVLPVWVVVCRVLQDLPEQQRVFHQPAARDVQEVPQVQLPAKGRLETALQEVLDPPILLLLVQQSLSFDLVTAVWSVGAETGQLQGQKHRGLVTAKCR